MANPFVHVELNTTDFDIARDFYAELFDWNLRALELKDGAYTTISPGEGTGGGVRTQHIPGAPSSWLPYVMVDDIAVATDKARSLGATIIEDATEIPDMGFMSIIRDPTGASLGLWQPIS